MPAKFGGNPKKGFQDARFKKIIMKKNLFFLSILLIFLGFAGPAFALQLADPLGGVTFAGLIAKITGYISSLIAGLAVLMFVWGAILFTVSAGNEGRIATAKKVLIYAAVGAAIALAGGGLVELIKNIIGP